VKIRLYLDEDSMRQALVVALRARGLDVQTALEAGLTARSDEEHLSHAATEHRVLYSFNVGDFFAIHTAWQTSAREHFGIVQQRYSVGEQMRRLLRLVAARPMEQMKNRLEFLSVW
jgi:hypothetical protein